MSKRCPDCGFINEDSKIYCGSCGELLDPELRLIKQLNDHTSGPKKSTYKEPPARREPIPPKNRFDEDYVAPKLAQKKKKSNVGLWLFLGIVLVVVGVLIVKYAL